MGDPVEVELIAVVFGLFLLPRILERWFVPSAITAFVLGIGYRFLDLSLQGDTTINFLAILGISALFLIAGIEVELHEMRKVWRELLAYLAVRVGSLAVVALTCRHFLGVNLTIGIMVAIGLLTPSTGFILDALKEFPLNKEQRFWVKSKAIAAELLALGLMFIVMQSGSTQKLVTASAGMLGVVVLLPITLYVFAKLIAPYARNAEFSFFILLAVIVGIATKKLGTYYLVGAFIVGLSVQRFEHLFPVMNLKKIFSALKLFCAFFVPFYFFRSGAAVAASDFSAEAIKLGVSFVVLILPLRIGSIVLQRRLQLGECFKESLPIALSLTPTLVFGLVVASILREQYAISGQLYGALIIYTMAATVIPGLILRNSRFQDVQEPHEVLQA